MTSLFDPIRLGAIDAPNRILMAPLTRGRGTRHHVPTPLMATYYAQRASAGLIISEATGISQEGLGWPYAPGIWSDAQVEAWRPVTAAVHEAGGRILCQLWHMGRAAHPDVIGAAQPVSASATAAPGMAHTYEGKKPYVEARPLRLEEIPRVLADYRHAAANALAAGFDGVQIHAANGYLIDQFLKSNSNLRTDAFGGSIDNRMRLLLEVTEAVVAIAGADRTAIRLSPQGPVQGVDDDDPVTLFGAVARRLSAFGLAFLELREPGPEGTFGRGSRPAMAPTIRRLFAGPLVLNSDYDGEGGQRAIDMGFADAIAFGRTFLANPDLPERLRAAAPLNPDDPATWYAQGREGYVDYPTLAEAMAAEPAG